MANGATKPTRIRKPAANRSRAHERIASATGTPTTNATAAAYSPLKGSGSPTCTTTTSKSHITAHPLISARPAKRNHFPKDRFIDDSISPAER